MGRITVVHKRAPGPAPGAVRVYVGRGMGSVLGNPFSHLAGTLAQFRVATREEAIARYSEWFQSAVLTDVEVSTEVRRIAVLAEGSDVELACWCTPLACHGDVIRRHIDPTAGPERRYD